MTDESTGGLPFATGPGFAAAEKRVLKLIPVVVLLLLWEGLPRLGLVSDIFLPPFSEVLQTFAEMVVSFELIDQTIISLRRGFVAYLLAIAFAIPLGVLIGWQQKLYNLTETIIDILRPLPSVALIPVFLLFLGPGEATIFAIIFYPVFFYQLIATIYGTLDVSETLIDSMKVIEVEGWELFSQVFVPASLNGIFTGIRQTIATMLILVIVAEMLLANEGLGAFILTAQRNFFTSEMYAAIVMIGFLGYALNKAVLLFQRRALYWSERQFM